MFSTCMGLEKFTSVQTSYENPQAAMIMTYSANFNSSVNVGVLKADRHEWETDGSCNISMLSDILQLQIFDRQGEPTWEKFWNFYSPFYGIELGWFQGLTIIGGYGGINIAWLEALQNTSLRLLNVTNMWSKEVDGNDTILIRDMPFLTTLILDGNDISSFHEDSFIGTPEMKTLIIVESLLDETPPVLRRLPRLRTLRISKTTRNCDFTISTEILSTLKFIETLDFSGNWLYSLSRKLPVFPRLKKLYLRKCRIASLKKEDINFPELQELDLSRNSLTYLEEDTFIHLQHLTVLQASQNNISNWPKIHGCSLEILNLSQNSLSYIENLGATSTTVKFLNISRNKIEKWKDKYVFSIEKLSTLESSHNQLGFNNMWVKNVDLSRNNIIGFSEVMIQSVSGLQQLDLGGNEFDCVDCRMIPFQKWLNESSTNVTNLGTNNPLLCSSPINNKGYPIVAVQFDESPCITKRQNWWISLAIPVGFLFMVVASTGAIIYHFRSPLTYIMHLYKIRKRSRNFSQTAYGKYAFDAFICYSSHDRRFVLTRLAPFLEKGEERYTLCLHERDFPLGSHIVENIVGSIQHSRKTWCNWELEMANHKMFNEDEHFLILIQLGKLVREKLPRHLQFLMDTRTYLEWPDQGEKSEEEQLFVRLKKSMGPSIFQQTQEPPPSLYDVMESYE
ncbi:toll-like receptor 2 type-2 isoform X2 [Anabrus simplex]|uniref:toll-like receptor 2 type-2 isoform X2 n=1 Tax=Anabrus simplex TaxID=316456 RepID=UPI0035A3044B